MSFFNWAEEASPVLSEGEKQWYLLMMANLNAAKADLARRENEAKTRSFLLRETELSIIGVRETIQQMQRDIDNLRNK